MGINVHPSFITAPCISAYLIHLDGKTCEYLLLRRCGQYLNGTWQMVSGSVEEGEKAYEAAFREILEETGLKPDRFYSADSVETFYLTIKDAITFVPVFVGFVDQKEPVQLSPTEHDAYQWLPYHEARELLVFSEQKRIIQHIHHNFVLKAPHPILQINSY